MITTKKLNNTGAVVVFSNRVRIGYIVKGDDDVWLWELILLSEQFKGHPRGLAASKDNALAVLSDMFGKWCKAAGLKDETHTN